MPVFSSRWVALAAAALGWPLTAAPASASVDFCNEFEHAIYVAIAYQQDDETWLSRGWLYLDPHECGPFDTALSLNAFYFRGESVEYKDAKGKRHKYTWGKDRNFAIWEDDNFNYWGAEKKVLNSRLELFTASPTTEDEGGLDITLTFEEGSVVTTLKGTKSNTSSQSHGSQK